MQDHYAHVIAAHRQPRDIAAGDQWVSQMRDLIAATPRRRAKTWKASIRIVAMLRAVMGTDGFDLDAWHAQAQTWPDDVIDHLVHDLAYLYTLRGITALEARTSLRQYQARCLADLAFAVSFDQRHDAPDPHTRQAMISNMCPICRLAAGKALAIMTMVTGISVESLIHLAALRPRSAR